MRKSLILMLIATLLVGAFLVSCNSDISSESSNGDKLVKVTIAGNAKGISAVSTSDDADNYYWYYSATKDDSGVYRTGQTDWKAVKANNETGLSGADLGYFSSGAWKFSFYGYTTAQTSKPDNPESSSVYYQKDNAVKVVPTTDTPTYVSVTLKEGSLGETATLVINKMNWKYTPESSTAYSATLANLGEHKTATIHFSYLSGTDAYTVITTATGDVKLYTSADETTTNASDAAYAKADFSFTGNYTIPASFDGKENTIKFWVTIGDETVGDEDTINVVAYSGGVVTLSIDSTGVAVADNEAFNKVIIDENTIGFTAKRSVAVSENKSAAKTIVTKAAPSTESNALTSITFPEGALVASAEDNTTYDVEMDVVVYQTEAAQAKFVIEDTSTTAPSTFAGLDISATLTTTTGTGSSTSPVSQFSDNTAVTIRTYIAKNLTGVQVVYNGSAGAQPTFSGVSFNSEEEFADSSYETGYVKSTGLLVFKTTHFSEFYVGANEKVYDKKTNSGYTVAAFNELSASVISDHEFILLDAAVANDIDDSRDVFNAGFNWSVVHKASETAPSSDFAGGYGTKIEPYQISSRENLAKVSLHKDVYSYYLFSGITEIDCRDWNPLFFYGSVDGRIGSNSNIKLKNLDKFLFDDVLYGDGSKQYIKNIDIDDCNIVKYGYGAAALADDCLGNVVFDDITVNGYIEGRGNSSVYVAYGTWDDANTIHFKNCDGTATLLVKQDGPGIYVGHHGTNTSVIIEDCNYTGTVYTTNGKANLTSDYTTSSYGVFSEIVNGVTQVQPKYGKPYNNVCAINYYVNDVGSKQIGDNFTVQATTNSVKAVAEFMIGPDGNGVTVQGNNYTGTYMTEQLTLNDGSYTTSAIKYYNIAINPANVTTSGLVGHTYNVVNSNYGQTYSTASIMITEYDSNNIVVAVHSWSLPVESV